MKIALIRPGSLGDIVMICGLLPPLRRYHDVTLFIDPRMFEVLGDWIRKNNIADTTVLSAYSAPDFDKTINLIGYPLAEGYPYKPMAKHLLEYFAAEMDVPFTFDGFCLPMPAPLTSMPSSPYITIQNKSGWSAYKEWPQENWRTLVEMLCIRQPNLGLWQVGGPHDPPIEGLNGRLCDAKFEDQVTIQAWAAAHVGLDSVFNHTTNIQWEEAGRTRAVILGGSTQPSASGYPHNTNISLGLSCSPCFREDPKVSGTPLGPCINPPNQTYDNPKHACMAGITPEMVYKTIERVLQ